MDATTSCARRIRDSPSCKSALLLALQASRRVGARCMLDTCPDVCCRCFSPRSSSPAAPRRTCPSRTRRRVNRSRCRRGSCARWARVRSRPSSSCTVAPAYPSRITSGRAGSATKATSRCSSTAGHRDGSARRAIRACRTFGTRSGSTTRWARCATCRPSPTSIPRAWASSAGRTVACSRWPRSTGRASSAPGGAASCCPSRAFARRSASIPAAATPWFRSW